MNTATQGVPLCVDLDGTLIRSDLLHEALFAIAKQKPALLFELFLTLPAGKAAFKAKVSQAVSVDGALLPYREDVVSAIEEARAQGQTVVLCTASPEPFARAVASHLGLFDEVLASSQDTNLASEEKANSLVERFGEGQFDYIGNSDHDLAIFAKCRRGTLISSRTQLRDRCSTRNSNMEFADGTAPTVRTWIRALRLHQWVKNLLIFVPLIAGHAVDDVERIFSAVLAFVAFGFCASSTYILNDLLDLQADRAHHTKKRRPFAAGDIPVSLGVAVSLFLLLASFLLASMLPSQFVLVLTGYLAVTLAYSLALKRQVVVDVILLAGLYTMRIVAGAAATEIAPSFWLLGFSMFMFLSLALVKRISELKRSFGESRLAGRGYVQEDLLVLIPLGSASGLISVLILALYMQTEIVSEMYPAKGWLWLVPVLVLYWVTRLWMKTNRNEIDDDPVVFATKDWQSLIVLGLIGVLFGLAIEGPVLW